MISELMSLSEYEKGETLLQNKKQSAYVDCFLLNCMFANPT